MKCECKDWQENIPKLESALALGIAHGMYGIKKSFIYCPYCSKELKNTTVID